MGYLGSLVKTSWTGSDSLRDKKLEVRLRSAGIGRKKRGLLRKSACRYSANVNDNCALK